jgi:hypothetical protein
VLKTVPAIVIRASVTTSAGRVSPVTANKLRVDVAHKETLPQSGCHVWSQLTTFGNQIVREKGAVARTT